MKIVKNKKIILAITDDFKIKSCIEDNLKQIGFDVITITPITNEKFKYKNLKERFVNFIKKNIYNDLDYKKTLRQNFNKEALLKKLNTVDYTLTIRADLFENDFIDKLIKCSTKNYAYQWDGLSRYERIMMLIPLFTKFYIFDKNDLSQKNITYPTTNFYFDCYEHLLKKEPKYDLYFLGSYDSRIKKLIPICELLHNKGYKLNIVLICHSKEELNKYPFIKYYSTPFSYYENLQMAADSKCIIDLHHDSLHTGLSFRTFEALGFNKKLITTNQIIKDYDFYNSQNIFHIDENADFSGIDDFIKSDYKEIDSIIKNKYSFTNWIKYILEIDQNTPIKIP
ncbi:hypothetical protein [Flavobacterium taihuense]|uniref:Uncharacterized protein n=1 Tax=Flavobacterium taihuense TaxID=2857508 RepID=A0ABS6XWQ0_9FLAO|nr:hypothetical protein [Flavobacterium taihuense]MBW4360787.1 hypothetical protein [Flavobacterium taihuense]